jgi:hypothetical protein
MFSLKFLNCLTNALIIDGDLFKTNEIIITKDVRKITNISKPICLYCKNMINHLLWYL